MAKVKKLTVRGEKPAGGLYAGDCRTMIGLCSAQYSTFCERASRGATCQSNLVRGAQSTRGFVAGAQWGSLRRC